MSQAVITPEEIAAMGGESLGSSLFRKLAVSQLDRTATAEERTKLARQMGHSSRTQRNYSRSRDVLIVRFGKTHMSKWVEIQGS